MINNSKEFFEIAQISKSLQEEYLQESQAWHGSPFEWITHIRSSRKRGVIGEKIISMWLASYDFSIGRSPDAQADRIIEGKRVEIKFSTLWESGSYTFQQIRDQNYDFAIMLGVAPHDAHCWVITKEEIIRLWKIEHIIEGQHTGRAGGDTAWIHVTPGIDNILNTYGGNLHKALKLISKYTNFYPKSLTEELDE